MFLLHLKQLALLRTHTALCQDMLPTEQCKLKRAIFPPPEARRKHAAWRCFFPLGCVLIRISGFVGEFFFKERVFQLSCRIFFWVSSIVKRNIRSIYIYIVYIYIKRSYQIVVHVGMLPLPVTSEGFAQGGPPVLKEISLVDQRPGPFKSGTMRFIQIQPGEPKICATRGWFLEEHVGVKMFTLPVETIFVDGHFDRTWCNFHFG